MQPSVAPTTSLLTSYTFMHELLALYPVTLALRVAWGDMDAFQHVNNTVYFRYFESARIAYREWFGVYLGPDGFRPR